MSAAFVFRRREEERTGQALFSLDASQPAPTPAPAQAPQAQARAPAVAPKRRVEPAIVTVKSVSFIQPPGDRVVWVSPSAASHDITLHRDYIVEVELDKPAREDVDVEVEVEVTRDGATLHTTRKVVRIPAGSTKARANGFFKYSTKPGVYIVTARARVAGGQPTQSASLKFIVKTVEA